MKQKQKRFIFKTCLTVSRSFRHEGGLGCWLWFSCRDDGSGRIDEPCRLHREVVYRIAGSSEPGLYWRSGWCGEKDPKRFFSIHRSQTGPEQYSGVTAAEGQLRTLTQNSSRSHVALCSCWTSRRSSSRQVGVVLGGSKKRFLRTVTAATAWGGANEAAGFATRTTPRLRLRRSLERERFLKWELVQWTWECERDLKRERLHLFLGGNRFDWNRFREEWLHERLRDFLHDLLGEDRNLDDV